MAFHSDQALDMVDESFIAVFTCYKHPELEPQRKLVVQLKDVPEDQAEAFEVPLLHNGVVVFSTETNRRFKHKIVLDSGSGATADAAQSEMLGITFRTSKTLIRFDEAGRALFEDGSRVSDAC